MTSEKKLAGFNAPSCELDDFRTPEYLLKFIRMRWGLHYDAACIEGVNNVVPKCLRLEDEWPKKRWPTTIYSNPPFDTDSIIKWIQKGHDWVNKVAEEKKYKRNERIHVMLIPNKLTVVGLQDECTIGTQPIWNDTIFLGGRICFEGPNIVKGGSSRNGCVLLIQRSFGVLNHTVEFIPLKRIKAIFKGRDRSD
tara:strand:+ start:473 stop:1054 length:582 start_codon:yes stop_codon:yes gene_type:complete